VRRFSGYGCHSANATSAMRDDLKRLSAGETLGRRMLTMLAVVFCSIVFPLTLNTLARGSPEMC
jgi:hypothetical protein